MRTQALFSWDAFPQMHDVWHSWPPNHQHGTHFIQQKTPNTNPNTSFCLPVQRRRLILALGVVTEIPWYYDVFTLLADPVVPSLLSLLPR